MHPELKSACLNRALQCGYVPMSRREMRDSAPRCCWRRKRATMPWCNACSARRQTSTPSTSERYVDQLEDRRYDSRCAWLAGGLPARPAGPQRKCARSAPVIFLLPCHVRVCAVLSAASCGLEWPWVERAAAAGPRCSCRPCRCTGVSRLRARACRYLVASDMSHEGHRRVVLASS